ncbi:MAG: hypothetical protein IKK57_08520 [Clostridia bacterium]|nr:hypothetical protein [Clostridia bacterium]
MSRLTALALALILSVTILMPAAAMTPPHVDTLGGTSWQNEEGVEFHFTAAAELFFSYTPGQTVYSRLIEGLYVALPFAGEDDAIILDAGTQVCTFTSDGTILLIVADGAVLATFTRVDRTADLAGTRWQNEYGEPFEFSEDGKMFSSSLTFACYARTSASIGAYYEMSFGPDGEMYYEPDFPCALLWDGSCLRLYTSRDGQSTLWLTFTPMGE